MNLKYLFIIVLLILLFKSNNKQENFKSQYDRKCTSIYGHSHPKCKKNSD